jgi:hypothetical protein
MRHYITISTNKNWFHFCNILTMLYHHHHHHHTACRVLVLVAYTGPTESLEVSRGVVLGFVSYMVDIS